MRIAPAKIPDVWVLDPVVREDPRGWFMETWRRSDFGDRGVELEFVQDNHSRSTRGTLRGLHYQLEHPQGKLVRAVLGEVFDVAVDLRRGSASFGRWTGAVLSSGNRRQMWIPPGFAHGFYVLSDAAEICYKCTEYYRGEDDRSLLWNDPRIGIDWPLLDGRPLLSDRDAGAMPLSEAPVFP